MGRAGSDLLRVAVHIVVAVHKPPDGRSDRRLQGSLFPRSSQLCKIWEASGGKRLKAYFFSFSRKQQLQIPSHPWTVAWQRRPVPAPVPPATEKIKINTNCPKLIQNAPRSLLLGHPSEVAYQLFINLIVAELLRHLALVEFCIRAVAATPAKFHQQRVMTT